jgi:hypothetical protein
MNDYSKIWVLGIAPSKGCAVAAFPPATGVGAANFDQAEG